MKAPLVKVPCKAGCGAMTRTRKPKPEGNLCFGCWLKERGETLVATKGPDGSLHFSTRKTEVKP
jgi:hypothetical protein